MKKSLWILIGILAGLILIFGSFTAGAVVGTSIDLLSRMPGFPGTVDYLPQTHPQIERDEDSLETLFEPFWESWDIVHEYYIDQPVDEAELMRGAIRGMLDSLGDQHTSYMDPDQFTQANIPMDGEYEGIGAWVDTEAEYLTIISPMPGSPAEEAGLLPGDPVVKIDGEDMTGLDGSLVIRKVLGPAGSTVVLTILREGEVELFDVTIVRAKITMPSVESEMLDDQLGYVQILTFGTDTKSELRKHLNDLLSDEPDGLIVDFRNNGGGYLQTAVDVGSEFIAEGVILYEDYGDDEEIVVFEALGGGLATEIPLVLLVNGGSASASEIVAGAVQDLGRGVLVGTTTFGKGSVQNWIELGNEQGAVRVTIARWLTPNERQIHEIGLTPDYEVELSEQDLIDELDPQLDKAIEVLLEILED
jgi:carboxyl-terminal processing protease